MLNVWDVSANEGTCAARRLGLNIFSGSSDPSRCLHRRRKFEKRRTYRPLLLQLLLPLLFYF